MNTFIITWLWKNKTLIMSQRNSKGHHFKSCASGSLKSTIITFEKSTLKTLQSLLTLWYPLPLFFLSEKYFKSHSTILHFAESLLFFAYDFRFYIPAPDSLY